MAHIEVGPKPVSASPRSGWDLIVLLTLFGVTELMANRKLQPLFQRGDFSRTLHFSSQIAFSSNIQ